MTHTPQAVETIARALAAADMYDEWWEDEPGQQDIYRNLARAALDAMPTTFGQAMLDDAEAEIQQLRATIAAMPQPIDYAIYPLNIDNNTRWQPEKALAAAEQDRREGRDMVAVALYPIGGQQ